MGLGTFILPSHPPAARTAKLSRYYTTSIHAKCGRAGGADGSLRSTCSIPGETNAQNATPVHERVEERGGKAARGERLIVAGRRRRARRARQPPADMAERMARGRLGRGARPADHVAAIVVTPP